MLNLRTVLGKSRVSFLTCSQFVKPNTIHTNWKQFFSNKNQQPYFITTPIFYVNAEPHIGHAYTAVLADAAARFHRIIDHNPVIFSTGTDEHGLKIQQSASNAKKNPQVFCDEVSSTFLQAMQLCEIGFTDFIRTTEKRHTSNVQIFWETLENKGFIYQGKYEGWYCTADETYVPEEHTTVLQLPDGKQQRVSSESSRPVEWSSEENYMFRLGNCRENLKSWLNSGPVVQPARFYNLVKSWLDEELPDLSISRPSARLSWGIPVPGDQTQTMYVWLDALLNYLTVAKSASQNLGIWPPNAHVIGKDILKFHAIYWPAFLMAADMEPPKSLLVHGHWLVDDQKMSKTTGNVVSPKSCVDLVTASGLRYFLLHEGVFSNDGNFTTKMMVRIANTDLADGIGNLVNRCCGKSLNPSQTRPAVDRASFEACGQAGSDLFELLQRTPDIVYKDFKEWHFHKGIDQIMALVRGANGFFQTMEPWQLKKSDTEKLKMTMAATMEVARVVGLLLQPIVPSFSDRMLNKLGVSQDQRSWHFARFHPRSSEYTLGEQKEVLFPRVKVDS